MTRLDNDNLVEVLVIGGVTSRAGCSEGHGEITSPRSGAEKLQDRRCRSFDGCVDFQLETLRRYFRKIREMAGDRGVSMGLSGGYDSRLMLLLAVEAKINVQPFTFSSEAHTKEMSVAHALAGSLGMDLRVIPVRKWTQLTPEELERNIDDSIAYYDGRTNATMGSFNDVHTARIQRECLGNAVINLNGMGGELYRNRERLPPYGFGFSNWFWHYVSRPTMTRAFFTEAECVRFERRMAERYGEILGLGKIDRMNRHIARRWYREVWLSSYGGVRLAAENRVGLSLMPFADREVSAVALGATPYIGAHGEFEAEMIRRLDAKIAALPSSYGPGFSKAPFHRRLRDFAMSLIPIGARLARHRAKELTRRGRETTGTIPPQFHGRFAPVLAHLRAMVPPVDLDFLLRDPVARDRALYIAEYLYRNRSSNSRPECGDEPTAPRRFLPVTDRTSRRPL